MAITCRQCSNTNPAGAKYCFFDGVSLSSAAQEGPVDPGSRPFPSPFVFPSGSQCENFDKLATICYKEWEQARQLLQEGTFERFFGGMGRADLAIAAKEGAAFPDLDRGLDQLIDRMPTQAVPRAKLVVEPLEVKLEPHSVGQDSSFTIKVRNQGARLLYGSVSTSAPWMQPGSPTDKGPKLFKCAKGAELKVSVLGQNVRAGLNPLEGKLVIETSGGNVLVKVKLDVPIKPFPDGVLGGAVTPRQVAEKAKKSPKQAAALFQDGSVARWYESNGWLYPVPGPAGAGIGAVQQYFEALGLTKPPRLQLKETAVKLSAAPGTSLRHILQITTPDNKPIFVHAKSDQSWLRPGQAKVKGATASLPLDIRQVPAEPGRTLSARVVVVGNGNQRFEVPVSLQVEGEPAAVGSGGGVPALEMTEDRPAPPRSGRRSRLAAAESAEAMPNAGAGQASHDTAVSREKTRPIVSDSGPANPFSDVGEAITAPAPRKTGKTKAVFAVDSEEQGNVIVARRPGKRSRPKTAGAKIAALFMHSIPLLLLLFGLSALLMADMFGRDTRVPEIVEESKKTAPTEPKITVDVGNEVVESEAFGPPKIEDEPEENINKTGPSKIEHKIKDEAAVSGDGIPIDPEPVVRFNLNPDASEAEPKTLTSFGIVANTGDKQVKKLTYAEDGSTNSTVVMIDGKTQKFGNSDPGNNAYRYFPVAGPRPKKPLFSHENWGVGCDKDGKGGIMFEEILEVVPGGQPVMIDNQLKRQFNTVLVRYNIRNRDSKNAHKVGMRLQIDTFIGANDGVPFTAPGRPTLIDDCHDFKTPKEVPDFLQALEVPDLRRPETVAHISLKGVRDNLEPPSRVSITRWPGNDNQSWEIPVIPMKGKGDANGDSAVVLYWPEVEIPANGVRRIGFAYGLGTVSVANKDIDGNLGLTLAGSFEPDRAFTVTAYVKNPAAKQTVTLDLPSGLKLVSGDKVVTLAASKKTAVVTWKAMVEKVGEYRISVRSNPGATLSKVVTISRKHEAIAGGKFTMKIDGKFEPGQTFEVVANVTDPLPGQTLSLNLPPGLDNLEPPGERKVPTFPVLGEVRWKVKLVDPGRYQIRVASSTGVTQSKTLTVFRAVQPGTGFELKLDGDFTPGKKFNVIATVPNPGLDLSMKLELPEGLETRNLLQLPVPRQVNGSVYWAVKVQRPGTFPIRVVSSAGVAKKVTLTIKESQEEESGGSFNMELVDVTGPGREFRVVARVEKPVKNQKLTLVLPEGIQLLDPAGTVSVPAADKTGQATVTWRARLDRAGTLPVKIESSTGQAKTRVISIHIF